KAPQIEVLAAALKDLFQLYTHLPASDRSQVRRDGLHRSYASMSPEQRFFFTRWMALKMPYISKLDPEAQLSMRQEGEGQLLLAWKAAGRDTSVTLWLTPKRNWFTGAPRLQEGQQVEALAGKPAPGLSLVRLDGAPHTLVPPPGQSFLL